MGNIVTFVNLIGLFTKAFIIIFDLLVQYSLPLYYDFTNYIFVSLWLKFLVNILTILGGIKNPLIVYNQGTIFITKWLICLNLIG